MLVLLGAAFLGGLVVFWLQLSTLVGTAMLALGARSFQTSLVAAVDQLTSGDYEAGLADFAQVENAAHVIDTSANGWNLEVASVVPGLGTAVENWHNVATATTSITSSTGDLLQLFGDLSGKSGGPKIFSDGAIDMARLNELPPRVASIDDGIGTAEAALRAVNTDGPLAGVMGRVRDRALREVEPVQQAIDALVDLAPLLPDALGANGPKRYLVAIGNQAEMRAAGGAPLTLVLVEFDDGRITIPIKGQTSTQLFPPINREVSWWGPNGNPFFVGNPRLAPFVIANQHPSMLMSAREMAGAWVGGDFPAVDGVITLDLTAIGAVLTATGPVQSEAFGEVTGDRLGEILLVEAYQEYGQAEADARQLANQELLDTLLNRLLSGDDLVSAAQAVASTAPWRHFQVWMRDTRFETLVIDSGAGGVVQDPHVGDWSAVYTQNGNQSKVDVFQQRNTLVTVQLQSDGSARVTQQMTVTNATPADRPEGPPERVGYETSWLKNAYLMYVPDAARSYRVSYPTGFSVRPFRGHKQFGRGFVDDGYGQRLIRVVGWTPPGGQAAVSVSYELPAGTFDVGDGTLRYRLHADTQSMFIDPTLTVRVTGPDGWTPIAQTGMLVTGQTAEASAVLDGPLDVAIDFERG